jgi:hypothetical protein
MYDVCGKFFVVLLFTSVFTLYSFFHSGFAFAAKAAMPIF